MELLRPHEIRAALAIRSVVYIPLGTVEWHSEHLPVGLDGLTAQGLCLGSAARGGGLVYPPLYFGTGGDHSAYPWTVMMDDDREISAMLSKALVRLQTFGILMAVLFSGHFAEDQLAMIDRVAADWSAGGNAMRVLVTSVNRIGGLTLGPDHAGRFETTLLAGLWPDRVDLSRLPSLQDAPLAEGDVWAEGRHDPKHPIWGVIGPDPRTFRMDEAPALAEAALEGLAVWVRAMESGDA